VYKLKPYTVGMLIKLDLKRFLVFVLSELFSMAYRWYITSEHAPILLIHHSWVSHVNIISLNNIYLMTFQHTIIQIYIYLQCSMGFNENHCWGLFHNLHCTMYLY
jgi:hypothetical protein